jgi:hypothetical protein
LRLHHIGYVVQDIDQAAATLPAGTAGPRLVDDLQVAELALFDVGHIFIEFIRPLGQAAFTWRHLEAGGGYHHVCWAAASLDAVNQAMMSRRLTRIRGPMPAVLFGGKQVLFAISRRREIVEFLVDPDWS